MRRLLQFVLALLLIGYGHLLVASEIIDAVAATVNSSAILQSDVEEASRYEAFVDGRPPQTFDGTASRATLERLIDQELLRQQIGTDFPGPAAAELAERIRVLRQQFPAGDTDAGWQAVLARYGFDEAEVAARLRTQLQINRYIDQRLRPAIHVDAASVQAYYRDKLLPELKRSGVQGEPALRQVRSQIEEILVQQRMDEELTAWLRNLREQSRIRLGMNLALPRSNELQGETAEDKTPRGGK